MFIQRRLLLRRFGAFVVAVAGLLLFGYSVWPWTPFARAARPPRTIVFYGFSILGEAIDHGVFPEFQRQWRASTGEQVEIVSSFAGSGTVTNQLILGGPAHLALLSLELDAQKLADGRGIGQGSRRKRPS